MTTQSPLTILMPVYNAKAYLREAIDSILQQTYTDFELLIVDDCSTDGSLEIIQNEYNDSRIRIIQNETNLKLFGIYNMAMHEVQTEYLAYMHSDDIAFPHRFETQMKFMAEHPEVDVVGSFARLFGNCQPSLFMHPVTHDDIHLRQLFQCTLFDPSVVMRRKFLIDNNLQYDVGFHPVSDYEFWSRATKCGRFENIPEMLLNYRMHDNQTSNSKNSLVDINAAKVRCNLISALGFTPTEAEMELHESIRRNNLEVMVSDETILDRACDWFEKLITYNHSSGVYDHNLLTNMLQTKLAFWAYCFQTVQETRQLPQTNELIFAQQLACV